MSRRAAALELQSLVGAGLRLVDARQGWPSHGEVVTKGGTVRVSVWIAPVGLSHRKRDLVERRFQNPGRDRPIKLEAGCLPLLIGLWTTDEHVEVQAPVAVHASAALRQDRSTRFSVFVPLEALRTASATGWCETTNTDGEWLCCFHPSRLTDLLAALDNRAGASESVPLDKASVNVAGASVATWSHTPTVRKVRILELAQLGWTLEEIGGDVGVSRERVRQLLRDHPEIAATRKQAAAERRANLAAEDKASARHDEAELARLHIVNAGHDPDAVIDHLEKTRRVAKTARSLSLDPAIVRRLYRAAAPPFRVVERTPAATRRFEDEQMIDYLRIAAHHLKTTRLTSAAYQAFAGRQNLTPQVWPSAQSIMQRFGSWVDAVEAAGLEATRKREYEQNFPPARCREFVDRYIREVSLAGRRPTLGGYASWAGEHGAPSAATIRNRLGRWGDVLADALRRIDSE